jgi:2-oxoisovalerate ferredoxin oxidoreductase beta subunit
MATKIKYGKPTGFFDNFDRRPGIAKKNMHYCPGCGHGVLHKLIAEAISDLEMQDNMVIISPVGCSVFAYYYFDACGISVPHGRAPAVATGIVRANPHSFVISYQGDGDLGAIGFNNFIQAANRGENITVCFVNNGIYGMTGGQMAPTTLPGQKTATSPYGRSTENEGYPLKVSEMVAALDSPIYVERVALTSTKNIMSARKALRKGLTYMKEKRGFSLIEFLAGCPINLKKTPQQTDEWIEKNMVPYFPLGCFKDIGAERNPIIRPIPEYDSEKVKLALYPYKSKVGKSSDFRNLSEVFNKERRIKCAGFGGQGVLSLGLMVALMGQLRNFNVTWLPSYGPEMRGGTANCSVVLSREKVGSPIVDNQTNLLIVMNQPSMDKFLPELKENGVLLYDSSIIETPDYSPDKKVFSVKASDIAQEIGNIRYANSVILGALSTALTGFLEGEDKQDFDLAFEEAIIKTFKDKQDVIDLNLTAFRQGKKAVKVESVGLKEI